MLFFEKNFREKEKELQKLHDITWRNKNKKYITEQYRTIILIAVILDKKKKKKRKKRK